MITINRRLLKRQIIYVVAIVILTVPLVAAVAEESPSQLDPDSIMDGFVDLIVNLDDISTTIAEVPSEGNKSLPLSGRVLYSKSQNMLAFTLMNSLLDGMTLILDNNEQAVYLLTPSSSEAIKMSADVASAQLMMLGVGTGHSDSLMAIFEQFLPVTILNNFNLEPIGLTERDGQEYFFIKAVPKDASDDQDSTEQDSAEQESYSVIWIDPETYYLHRLENYVGDGNIGAFVLTDSSYNSGLDKSDFMALLEGKSIVNY